MVILIYDFNFYVILEVFNTYFTYMRITIYAEESIVFTPIFCKTLYVSWVCVGTDIPNVIFCGWSHAWSI